MNLTDLECLGVGLKLMHASELIPGSSLLLNLTGINTNCKGTWTLGELFDDHKVAASGAVTLKLASTNFSVGAILRKDKDMLITSVVPKACLIQTNPVLSFTGKGATPALISALQSLLHKTINKDINTEGCSFINGIITNQVSAAFQHLGTVLRPYINIVPHEVLVPPILSAINFKNTPAVSFLDYFFDEYLGGYLNKAIAYFVPKGDFIRRGLNKTSLTTNLTNTSTLTTNLTAIQITGLNKLTNFDFVRAGAPQVLESAVAGHDLHGSAELNISVAFQEAKHAKRATIPTITQQISLGLGFGQFNLLQDTEMVIDQARYLGLNGGEETNIGCILGVTDKLNMTSLDLNATISDFSVSFGNGDLDSDLVQVLNTIFNLTTGSLTPTLPKAVRGWFASNGREDFNTWFRDVASNTTCTMPDIEEVNMNYVIAAAVAAAILFLSIAFLALAAPGDSTGYNTGGSISSTGYDPEESDKVEFAPLLDDILGTDTRDPPTSSSAHHRNPTSSNTSLLNDTGSIPCTAPALYCTALHCVPAVPRAVCRVLVWVASFDLFLSFWCPFQLLSVSP